MAEDTVNDVVEDSLSSDLEAAWDKVEETSDETVQPAEPAYKPAEDGAAAEPRGADVHAEGDTRANTGDETGAEDKPPVGLSATAREAWKDTPAPVRAEIAKREKDFAVGIQKYAENANRAQMMDQALAPYQQYLAVTGEPPAKTIQTLLQTASMLQMGSPAQRASTVANLIKQFGVDIETLDNLLVGKPAPAQAPQPARDPELDDLRRFAQQVKQQQDWARQQGQNAVQSEVQTFATDPKNEFYRDVAVDMADILDLASRRNANISLGEAYEKACQLHPEVSKILAGRSAAPTASQRRAASSVTGAPGGTADNSLQADDVRAAIERAWDMQGRA